MNKILKVCGIAKLVMYKIKYFGRVKFSIKTSFHPNSKITLKGKKSKINLNKSTIDKNVEIVLNENAECVVENGVSILPNNYIQVGKNAELFLGEGTFINRNCHIVSIKSIKIGKYVALGNSISIFDHDHIVVANTRQDWTKSKKDQVLIGDNCWIASNVVILRGTSLGNNCVVGANTVIKGKVPPNTMCYNEINLKKKDIK